ncbi:hypothetical protein C7972_10141 [Arenibacter sp. ARW7G5Y1]|nr:hypothetical protein C7972_10141 [Arenibacter sp. ARW7G5Y1]
MKMKIQTLKMKNTILFLIVILSISSGISQNSKNKKTTIGLTTFEALDEKNYREAELLTETVKELFVESKRYIPLDRTTYAETAKYKEIEVQKNVSFINGVVAKQGLQKGAKYLIGGKLTAVEYADMKNGIDCKLSFSINISSVETGELMASETFTPGPISISADGIDEISAMSTQINLLRNKIGNFIIANTPFSVEIIQLEKTKKGANILINVGVDEGVEKGNRFAIYKVSSIAGLTRKQEIIKFSIDEVQGGISVGGIKKNMVDELDQLINDPNVELSCEEIECKICFNKFKI